MMRSRRVVGIIGGMGPAATVELMRRVVARTPAEDDEDHVHLIVDNNPQIPSRIAHLIDRTGPDPTPELQRMARGLESAGAEALAMPCNTAHRYADAIRAAVSIPLLDMVALTARQIATRFTGARVGLLASSAVLDTGVYARAFEATACTLRVSASQPGIMQVIRDVKRGGSLPEISRRFAPMAGALAAESDVLLIACTELSMLAEALAVRVSVVDSMDVLTEAIVAFANPTQ